MAVENKKVLLYSIYALAAVVWYVLWRFMVSVADFFLPQYATIGGVPLAYPLFLVALAIAIVAAEYTRRDQRAGKFGIEVIAELKKVTWPNAKEIRGSTLVVVLMTLVISAILFVFDKIFGWGLTLLW